MGRRTIVGAALAAVALASTVAGGVSASASAAAGGITPHACAHAVGPHFVERYNGTSGNFGCPVDDEFAYDNGGAAQNFQNGDMVWSPDQGSQMVVSALVAGPATFVDWGSSTEFSYDDWLILIKDGNGVVQQQDCEANSCGNRRSGGIDIRGLTPGHLYTVQVEGCDVDVFGSHTCRQGWTSPAFFFAGS